MVGRAAVIAAACFIAGAALAKKKESSSASKQPLALHLRSIDLVHRLIMIEVDGLTKAPPSNYFTMTDDRGHHYIAQTIHCDPPFPSGTRACELEIPAGYERHPLTALELHKGGLHGRPIVVEPKEVKAAWGAAEQAHVLPTTDSSTGNVAGPTDLGVLDSGTSRTDAGR
ncbi:MAG TPA: hypothetical protein VN947_21750 [Polyangia bacterium]|nr:hypothetical protein [Polyangia bacterium]